MKRLVEIIFQIEGGGECRVSAEGGANLLGTAREAGIAVDAPCSGSGSCGKCRMKLLQGELESVKPGSISDVEFKDGWRLACQSRLIDGIPVRVLVPETAYAYQCRIRTADLSNASELEGFAALQKKLLAADLGIGHPFRSCVCRMKEPTLDDVLPDNERLAAALKAESGAKSVTVTMHAVTRMAAVMRANHFTVGVLYRMNGDAAEVWDLYPSSEAPKVCGIAIDIGTTTVSAVLTDLMTGRILAKASAGNAQIRYGADVINRIIEQNRTGGRERLQNAITGDTLLPLVQKLEQTAGVEAGQVVRVTVAANTTMNHLLLGACADPIRTEPYIPSFFRCDPFPAVNLIPAVNPSAQMVLAPNIGSYVGGDITAGTMAGMMWKKEEFTLFIDLGTNGEIVFGNREFLMSCACSAGPAFEGGEISSGMRATDGAIEAVTIDAETMEPSFKVVGDEAKLERSFGNGVGAENAASPFKSAGNAPIGICGSGIIDLVAELYRCGMIDARGRFIRGGERILRDEHGVGRYVLVKKEDSAAGREVSVTEVDLDSFIRAKGAIFSAVQTMLGALDMTPDVIGEILIAGGIGSGINMENAVRIGMFPDVERERFRYIGNSSLAGAYAMLLSDSACEKVFEVASNMTYIELSTDPGYMDRFVAACFLPHTDPALFPSCSRWLR